MEDYPKKLKEGDRLNAILPYVGSQFTSDNDSGELTLSVLAYFNEENFKENFSVKLKSLDDITEEDALAVFRIAIGGRSRHFEITDFLIKCLSESDKEEDKIKLAEVKDSLPKAELGAKQFHVDGGKMYGRFDFWHGHKSLKELHFGFETENPSSYAEYSCMNPHMILQYLQKKGYMIPYNGVDLFDDGIAKRYDKED